MHRDSLLFLLAIFFIPAAGLAEVIDSTTHGFTCRSTARVPAPPNEVYAKLVQGVGMWWSSDHTYSGDARNLRIEARQGGCFCETLPNGGSVEHLSVVYADPGTALRLLGGLGPLQATATTGAMTWQLTGAEGGTDITVTYTVGGYVPEGLDSWAEGVDRVVGEQLQQLARFIATGRPEEAAAELSPESGGSR